MSEEKFESEEFDDLLDSFKIDDIDKVSFDGLKEYFGFDIMDIENQMEDFQDTLEFRYWMTNPDSKKPTYAYPTDSGFDLYSVEEVYIEAFGRQLIPTGLHVDIPEGYEIQVRSKSGLALKDGLMVLNSPGTVDQGYTGEIQVILFNTTNKSKKIDKGQKIAQAVLCPVVSGKWINFVEVSNEITKDRNSNGFGSTGI